MTITSQRIIQCILAVVFLVLSITNWRFNYVGQNIINLLPFFILVAGFDNIVIFYRCYLNQPSFQLEATFLILSVFILGNLFQSFNRSPTSSIVLNQICYFFVFTLLAVNLLYFAVMVIIIIGYFFRHVYRLFANELLSMDQVLDQTRLQAILNEERQFEDLMNEIPEINTGCSICLTQFEKNTLCVKLPGCEHCFHRQCIEEWLKQKITCPYCRNNIVLSSL